MLHDLRRCWRREKGWEGTTLKQSNKRGHVRLKAVWVEYWYWHSFIDQTVSWWSRKEFNNKLLEWVVIWRWSRSSERLGIYRCTTNNSEATGWISCGSIRISSWSSISLIFEREAPWVIFRHSTWHRLAVTFVPKADLYVVAPAITEAVNPRLSNLIPDANRVHPSWRFHTIWEGESGCRRLR